MKQFYALIILLGTLFTSVVFADADAMHDEVKKTGKSWSVAIASRNPAKITALYDEKALLYATFTTLLNNPKDIKNYFIELTQNKDLKVNFDKQDIRVFGDDVALNSGLYTFSYTKDGKTIKVPGRYTFVYHKGPNGWMIIDHHSSVSPEKN